MPGSENNHDVAELKERTAGPRFLELDGLRGIAAFTVIWTHFWSIFSLKESTFVLPFISGTEAVNLFFLLSGFVLSLPFWNKGTTGPYGSFLVRRIFRIYVPFAAALCLAILGDYYFGRRSLSLHGWFYETWQRPMSLRLLVDQFFLPARPEMNTAFWSLRYEMQLSIIFPFLLLLLRWLRPLGSVLFAFGLMACATLLTKRHATNFHNYLDTMRFGTIFIVGAITARNRARIQVFLDSMPRIAWYLFIVFAFAIYCGYAQTIVVARLGASITLIVGAFCALIVAAFFSPFRELLRLRIPEYMGRISYSLYLVHATVLFVLTISLYGKLSIPAIGALYLVLSMLLAHLFCVAVEEPSLRLGKKIALRMNSGSKI